MSEQENTVSTQRESIKMIKIKRWYHDDCTIGRLTLDDFQCFTLELPDKKNQRNISCIPEGVYQFKPRVSSRNGEVLELVFVPNRTYIQVHAGNYATEDKLQGCILVGDSIKWLNDDGIPDVTNSKKTLKEILKRSAHIDLIELR